MDLLIDKLMLKYVRRYPWLVSCSRQHYALPPSVRPSVCSACTLVTQQRSLDLSDFSYNVNAD